MGKRMAWALSAGAAFGPPAAGQDVVLQYGFDYTDGTVRDHEAITDDSGCGHDAEAFYGDGGRYTPDIPTFGTRCCAGIGSLLFDGYSSAATETDVGIVSAAEIFNAGGLTVEAWVRGLRWNHEMGLMPAGVVCTVARQYGLAVHEVWEGGELMSRRLVAMHGLSTDVAGWPGVETETDTWTHLAAVYSGPTGTPDDMLLDITLFVSGELAASLADARFDVEPALATSIGNGPLLIFGYEFPLVGWVYEPRVSVGALVPELFTLDPCPADFSRDGVVDTRDLRAFLNAWAAGEPRTDANRDGVVDTRDVLEFLNLWRAGC